MQEAISSFMFQVQELRSANTMANAKVSSLKQEVEDSERELSNATARIDLLTSQVEAHHAELGKLSKQHERELMKKESEVSGLETLHHHTSYIRMGSQSVGYCLFVCSVFVCLFVCLSVCLFVRCDDLCHSFSVRLCLMNWSV